MLKINQINHVAIICSDIEKSKTFNTEILGFKVQSVVDAQNTFAKAVEYQPDLILLCV